MEHIEQLHAYKNKIRTIFYQAIEKRCTILHQLEIYNFIIANNKLIEKGYVITDENKDKKFLEIVETEDDELISDLERYLYSKDYISPIYNWYTEIKEFQRELEIANSEEEVKAAAQKYFDRLN